MSEWTLTIDTCGRPLTSNAVHRMSPLAVSAARKEWRTAAGWLARQASIPALSAVAVACHPRYSTRRSLPDVDAVAPTLKAVLDGIVDAGVIPDDGPGFVHEVTYRAPVVAPGVPALVVTVREVES